MNLVMGWLAGMATAVFIAILLDVLQCKEGG